MEINCIEIHNEEGHYLIPVDSIEAVLSSPDIVRVPGAPDYLIGISIYERAAVPYYYMSEKGNCYKEKNIIKCGIILRTDRGYIGIAADEISEEKKIAEDEYEEQMTGYFLEHFGGGIKW